MAIAICNTAIDWAATGTMLQGIGTLAGVAAVIWAAIKGTQTFDEWSRQKLAERKLDQAERILTAAYRGRRALSYVRGIMLWGRELRAAEEQIKLDPSWSLQTANRQQRLITAQALFNRIKHTKDDRQALVECLPMARALFGTNLEKAIEKLANQFRYIEIDIDTYVDLEDGTDPDLSQKLRRGMFEIDPIDGYVNDVSKAISDAIIDVENICLPALRLEDISNHQ